MTMGRSFFMQDSKRRGTSALPLLALILILALAGPAPAPAAAVKKGPAAKKAAPARPAPVVEPVVLREVWAYLMRGEEKELTGTEPFTDVAYFGCRLDRKGTLVGPAAPPSQAVKGAYRWHLVVAEINDASLLHFLLNPALPFRAGVVKAIAERAAAFDGVQIDFEAVPADDREQFLSFLADLKKALPAGKTLSVALPPRRTTVNDAYPYGAIAAVVDRVIIMAYDQHWSTSAPGPVAALAWCREVAEYARRHIDREKLVMGLPLYGRAWQDTNHARSLRDAHVKELLRKKSAAVARDRSGNPSLVYRDTVTVRVYYNTLESLLQRLRLYTSLEALKVSFWRIGQGDRALWKHITIKGD